MIEASALEDQIGAFTAAMANHAPPDVIATMHRELSRAAVMVTSTFGRRTR